jgi:hypothetical protein
MARTVLDLAARMGEERGASSPLSDVCLLLRANAEQSWLNDDVAPVVRELQQCGSLPEELLTAALVYLEVIWIEASRRAEATDAAYDRLLAIESADERALFGEAHAYHATVSALRSDLARRVEELLVTPVEEPGRELAHS